MSSDIKTLADAQHGGRVRLANQALSNTELRRNAHVLVLQELRARFTDAGSPSRTAALDAAIATLSAHPSPGGQDALAEAARRVLRDIDSGDYHGEISEATYAALEAALAARQPVGRSFQAGVAEWMGQCFLPSLYSNMTERGDRLLEEVLELLQAHGYDKARVPTLVDYVFGRPVGEPAQEVGGVMVTLAGYCWVAGLDMHAAGDAELARISQPEVMAKIRAKQEAKNALHFDTPLPGNAAAHLPAQAVDLERVRQLIGDLRTLDVKESTKNDNAGFVDLRCYWALLGVAGEVERSMADSQAVGNG
ncbi:TPA: hypothetical protein ACKQBZ_000572 [Stenotrophomonas maltophilia]